MQKLLLAKWSEFENKLRPCLQAMGHEGLVTVRNFAFVTFTNDFTETDRLAQALSTGTDRDSNSPVWNVEGFDYPHDKYPAGKSSDEIIYAFTIDLAFSPYLVHHEAIPESFDITKNLTEHDAILVYDEKNCVESPKRILVQNISD